MRRFYKSLAICAIVTGALALSASCTGNKANLLTAHEWELEEIVSKDSCAEIVIPGKISISFNDSSMVYGNAGCNRFFARYQTDNSGKITINPPGATMMWCLNMPFENTYLKMIELADGYTVSREKLTISGPGGSFTLTYRPLAEGEKTQPVPSTAPLQIETIEPLGSGQLDTAEPLDNTGKQ